MKLQFTNATKGSFLTTRGEVADTHQKKLVGLLGRRSLSPGEGLWIPAASSIHTYQMQFPIDVVFLGPQGEVLDVLPDVTPGSKAEREGADSVLELPAGMIVHSGTEAGDVLQMQQIAEPINPLPGCVDLLNIFEGWGVLKPGTGAAVSTLMDHAQKFQAGLRGVRLR